ncbi:MAG TPA: type IV secretion system DNA-binding domain-containing protein, partial [Lacipirellulaceae bacterium]|nr:type IV secretion system DNA-binding domain-containing protein [Lacipirellulaceae bacterium]
MSNFNFPGNNHSLSEPGPNAALPATYPFALTKEFRAAFTEEGGADLPSSYKLAYWWEHTGNAAQQREDECAAECNRLLQADYETAVARIERQNRVRTRRNKRDRGAFQRAIAEFAGAHAAWRRRWEQEQGEWERRQQEQIRREARDALSSAIDGQSEAVALAVTNVVDVTEQERRESGAGRAARWSLWLGFLTIAAPFAGVFATPVFSALAYELRQAANRKARRQLAWRLGNYGKRSVEEQQLAQRASLTSWVTFHLHGCGVREVHDTHVHPGGRFTHYFVESPVAPVKPDRTPDNHDWRNDERPLGVYPDDAFDEPATTGRVAAGLATRAVMWIPFLGLALNGLLSRFDGRRLRAVAAKRVNTNAILAYRRATLAARLEHQLNCPEVMAQLTSQRPAAVPSRAEPKPPAEPTPRPLRPLPAPPVLQTALQISPPADCFDTPEMDDAEHVFKGSQVFALEQVLPLARALLFADDCVRPYFPFGGAPFAVTGNAPHKMIVGTTGSGKTTALLRLMSSHLPLSRAQAQRIADYIASEGAMYPGSSHEWSRSRTHQAVVYNAKGEYLPYLEAFGFDRQVDLFNLDPEDPQGYAWDVAADINDRNSIEKFAEQLVPMNTAASRDRHVEFWLGAARRVIEAIIICLRNAARSAGKEPAWTLRDLVTAASTDDAIRHLLRWHDTPLQKEKELFGLSDAQTSSIMLTLRESLGHFALLANRWHDAKKRGRTISLKAWSKNGAHSVLVLPNTMANISAHGPLNKSVFKALTDLWLSEEYSFSVDGDGRKRPLHRHMYIDEFGHAGRFDDLERIMGEGRAFGVNVVLGLHQLSQAREAYGENGAETIVGLCSYFAFLKSNDLRTQKWMSEVVGNCLRSYEKASFSYSTSQGQTVTASHTTTEGQS